MSLLTLCQQVARTVPMAVPANIIGNSDKTAQLLLASAQDEGESLSRRTRWVSMVKEHTFTTVASTADYSLPSDFSRLINDTVWDRSNYWKVRGPLNAQEWQQYKSSVLSDTVTSWKRYRIRDVSGTVKFSIDPTPDSADSMVFEYASNAWCESAGGAAQTTWTADSDVGVLDEYLIRLGVLWRVLKRLGMSYAAELQEYKMEVDTAIARDGSAPTLDLSCTPALHLLDVSNVPDTGYGS